MKQNRNTFAIFGPRISTMNMSSEGSLGSSKEKAKREIIDYEMYHKGYKIHMEDSKVSVEDIDQYNEDLKGKYDLDPRVFWNDSDHSALLSSSIRAFASYLFSILAGSAGPEREFSRMGYLLSSRRTRYTATNTNKRLTLANLLPQKRKLERLLSTRRLKRSKLFDEK